MAQAGRSLATFHFPRLIKFFADADIVTENVSAPEHAPSEPVQLNPIPIGDHTGGQRVPLAPKATNITSRSSNESRKPFLTRPFPKPHNQSTAMKADNRLAAKFTGVSKRADAQNVTPQKLYSPRSRKKVTFDSPLRAKAARRTASLPNAFSLAPVPATPHPETVVQLSEHPLSTQFKESTALYKKHIEEHFSARLNDTSKALQERIDAAGEVSKEMLEKQEERVQKMTAPLGDEVLLLTTDRGSADEVTVEATMRDRIKTFEALVREEKEILVNAYEKWTEVVGEYKELVKEEEEMEKFYRGLEAHTGKEKESGDRDFAGTSVYAKEVIHLEEEYLAKQAAIEAHFSEASKTLLAKVKKNEDASEAARRRCKEQFFKFFRQAMQEVEDTTKDSQRAGQDVDEEYDDVDQLEET